MNDTNTESKKTILVAEDEADLREALFTILTSEGFEVLLAEDGEQALDLAFKNKPDLILLDMIMPNVDGHGVLDKLRNDEWGKNVKVIVLTALSDLNSLSKTLEHGGLEYLVKTDWKLEDIATRVRQRLED